MRLKIRVHFNLSHGQLIVGGGIPPPVGVPTNRRQIEMHPKIRNQISLIKFKNSHL